MKFEDIQRVNETISTLDVKGKQYAEVNQRIKAFRMLYPMGTIETEMLSNENGVCVFRASIFNEDGALLGTGTAYEKENSTFINKTSYIENCETSAVGRALAMCGIGIDTSVASAEEVQNAINNQNKEIEEVKDHQTLEDTLDKLIASKKIDYNKLCEKYKLAEPDIHHLNIKQLQNAIDNIDKFEKIGE